jgi:hypothetical protein
MVSEGGAFANFFLAVKYVYNIMATKTWGLYFKSTQQVGRTGVANDKWNIVFSC